MEKPSGLSPLVWVFTAVALVALAYFGWRSNQAPTVATPASAPAEAQQQQPDQRQESAPVVTETNGGLAG